MAPSLVSSGVLDSTKPSPYEKGRAGGEITGPPRCTRPNPAVVRAHVSAPLEPYRSTKGKSSSLSVSSVSRTRSEGA